jgi:hypothetical protein
MTKILLIYAKPEKAVISLFLPKICGPAPIQIINNWIEKLHRSLDGNLP